MRRFAFRFCNGRAVSLGNTKGARDRVAAALLMVAAFGCRAGQFADGFAPLPRKSSASLGPLTLGVPTRGFDVSLLVAERDESTEISVSSVAATYDGAAAAGTVGGVTAEAEAELESLKRSLLKLAASYDRGYGSTKSSRHEVNSIIDRLEALNPTADAARGISDSGGGAAPLAGIWRMVWTTAQDVLTLASSPLATIGSIYQVIEPPIATNIIDFIPRAQALFPPGVAPPTLLRAEVTTRASAREGKVLRVGLDFEAVKLKLVEVLGFPTDGVLPPLSFNLPRVNVRDLPGVDPENPPGYFDVAYLDNEMLIIRQNAPGGLFVLVKADNYDP